MTDEVAREKKITMEKKIDGKMKSVASIPANYVSILQLQERWMKEKERKQKEKDLAERGVKQQVNGQGRREGPTVKLVENGIGGGFRKDRWEKEPNCVEKEEVKVSATVSRKGEDGGNSREKKKKWCKKENKKNQGGSVKEVVKCETKAYIPREIPGENGACNSTAVETQLQDLRIKKRVEEDGRDREVKGPARLNRGQGYYRNQKHDWSSTRTMVWVKKEENDGAGGGNGVLINV